ncbi:MAG: GntR family transcriptional regulator [Egibacteraceae bacterium]
MAAKELVYALVKRQILSLELPPGAFVTEPEIAAQLGVSRTPVREAFLRLEAERLVSLVPHRGAQITPISAHEMNDVMEVRLVVELWCAQSVLDGRHVGVAERLGQALDDQHGLADSTDFAKFIELDRDFHRHLVVATGNEVMLELYDSLRDRQERMHVAVGFENPGCSKAIIAEHAQIAAAVAAGDRDAVERAVRDHLDITLEVLRFPPPRPSSRMTESWRQ